MIILRSAGTLQPAGGTLTGTLVGADPGRDPWLTWVGSMGSGWTSGSRWAWFGVLAVLAALVDAATTTAFVGSAAQIYEANPVAAAGQSAAGSVGMYMLFVSVPVVMLLALLPARPTNVGTAAVWSAVLGLGWVKILVAGWNVLVLAHVGLLL